MTYRQFNTHISESLFKIPTFSVKKMHLTIVVCKNVVHLVSSSMFNTPPICHLPLLMPLLWSQLNKAQDLLMKSRKYLKGCHRINHPMNTSKIDFIMGRHSYLTQSIPNKYDWQWPGTFKQLFSFRWFFVVWLSAREIKEINTNYIV